VGLGDTVLIPKGEKHWHGATPDSDFTHISLQSADSTTEQLEP
jgi:quercetin dioxygenase-like cupin family protein